MARKYGKYGWATKTRPVTLSKPTRMYRATAGKVVTLAKGTKLNRAAPPKSGKFKGKRKYQSGTAVYYRV